MQCQMPHVWSRATQLSFQPRVQGGYELMLAWNEAKNCTQYIVHPSVKQEEKAAIVLRTCKKECQCWPISKVKQLSFSSFLPCDLSLEACYGGLPWHVSACLPFVNMSVSRLCRTAATRRPLRWRYVPYSTWSRSKAQEWEEIRLHSANKCPALCTHFPKLWFFSLRNKRRKNLSIKWWGTRAP